MARESIRDVLDFDELNRLVGYERSEPYEEFYEPMKISKKQKRKRIDLAKDLDDVFEDLLLYMFMMMKEGFSSEYLDAQTLARDRYVKVASRHVDASDYLLQHADELIASVLLTLYRHSDDPYYYSKDRARLISENDANTLIGYDELQDAIEGGYQYKTWETIMDGRERESHAEVNGKTIPIDEPFELAGGLMMAPGDDSLGVSDDELVNCRCSLSYS